MYRVLSILRWETDGPLTRTLDATCEPISDEFNGRIVEKAFVLGAKPSLPIFAWVNVTKLRESENGMSK